ncbi:cox1 assembly protein [Niveomyces insectorum RCEF 264]|uniref:SURF1-like protein n=1 Tax=Niveomyces insectorum RCEF 264 TaxID=1081102 RepID=A0A167TG64_9HYPO|nr:cox1 assembly protein [Niveomyces insectorum RCEF 264]
MNSTLAPTLWQPLPRRLFATRTPSAAVAVHRRRLTTTTTTTAPCWYCLRRQAVAHPAHAVSYFSTSTLRRRASRSQEPVEGAPQPADDPNFTSILDNPPELVRSGRRHGPGLIVLALIPITAFALGTWQVFRLRWKTDLLAKCEDRLVRAPLPLTPANVDAAVAHSGGKAAAAAADAATAAEGDTGNDNASDFDYRRVVAVGTFRHDQEMLLGPRVHDGHAGYFVVTPFELADPDAFGRPGTLPRGLVRVEGMLRAPWKRNTFTPQNRPEKGEFYFPDVAEMAALTGSLPVWVEATMEPDLLQVYDMEAKGVPIGKPAEVNLRNNHAQYIFTWYSLSLATAIMLWMVAKKPQSNVSRRVRMNKSW